MLLTMIPGHHLSSCGLAGARVSGDPDQPAPTSRHQGVGAGRTRDRVSLVSELLCNISIVEN